MANKQTALTAEGLMQAQQKMIESGKLTAEQLKVAQEQLAKLQELVDAFKAETTPAKEVKAEPDIEKITQASNKDPKIATLGNVRDEVKDLSKTIEGKNPKSGRVPLPKVGGGDHTTTLGAQTSNTDEAVGKQERIEKIGGALPGGAPQLSEQAKSSGGGISAVISEKILSDIEKSRSPAFEKFMDLFSGRSAAPAEAGVPGAAATPSAGKPTKGAAAKPAKATKGDAQIINLTAKSVNLKGPVNITVTGAQAAEMMGSDSGTRRAEATALPAAAAGAATAAAAEDGGFDIPDIGRKGLRSVGRGLSTAGRMLRGGVSTLARGVSSVGRGVMTAAGRGGASTLARGVVGRGLMTAAGSFAAPIAAASAPGYMAFKATQYAQNKMFDAAAAGDADKAVQSSRQSSQFQAGAMGEFADPIQQQEAAEKEAKESLQAQAAKGNEKAAKALADMEAGRPTEADIKTAKEAKVSRKQEDLLKKGGTTRHWLTGSYKKAGTGFLGFGMEDASKADISAAEAAAEKSVTAEATSAVAGKPGEVAAAGIPVSDAIARAESKTQAVQVKKAADKIQAKRQAELSDKVARGRQAEAVGRGPVMSSGAKVESASVDNAVIKSAPAAPIIIPAAGGGSNTVNNTTNNIMPRADVRPNESAMERYTNKQAHFV